MGRDNDLIPLVSISFAAGAASATLLWWTVFRKHVVNDEVQNQLLHKLEELRLRDTNSHSIQVRKRGKAKYIMGKNQPKEAEQHVQNDDNELMMTPLVVDATVGPVAAFTVPNDIVHDDEVDQPSHIVLSADNERGAILVERKWIVAFWDSIVKASVISFIAIIFDGIGLFIPFLLLVGIPCSYLAYYCVYMAIASYRNTTYLTLTKRFIMVEHTPMTKFSKNKKVSTKGCSRAIIVQSESGHTNGNPKYAYAVHMIMEQGSGAVPIQHVILNDLCNYEEANFIQLQLSKHLRATSTKSSTKAKTT